MQGRRSLRSELLPIDNELERTLREQRRNTLGRQPPPLLPPLKQKQEMALVNQTLRELAQPTTTDSPLCIVYPTLDTNYELRSGTIHLLPHFCGHSNEDPHKHLKEFQVVSATMKPNGVSDEQVKLRLFPFSLKDKAKDWLYELPSGTITTWEQMARIFLVKFFPAKRASEIRKELVSIQQTDRELFHENWDRFKRLIASCPHHGLADANLVQYFY